MGRLKVVLETNGWETMARIRVIGESPPGLYERNLMANLGLQLVQQKPGREMMSGEQNAICEPEITLSAWQENFIEQFSNNFHRVEKLETIRYRIFSKIFPVQHKGRRVHIALLDRVDGKIAKQPKRGHIEKLEECSDNFFLRRVLNIQEYFEYRRIDGNRSRLIGEKKSERVLSTMDLTYRRKKSSVQFSRIGGKLTGTYNNKQSHSILPSRKIKISSTLPKTFITLKLPDKCVNCREIRQINSLR